MGYVAGQPFPLSMPMIPTLPPRIMWNKRLPPNHPATITTLRFYDCYSLYQGTGRAEQSD